MSAKGKQLKAGDIIYLTSRFIKVEADEDPPPEATTEHLPNPKSKSQKVTNSALAVASILPPRLSFRIVV